MILTTEKQLLDRFTDIQLVDLKKILKFDGNKDVTAIVASRALARLCQDLSFPNLRFIQLLSAGYEGVDIDFFRERGIIVSNAANVYSVGMAEFIVYAMLMSAKRYNKRIKNNNIRYQRNYKYISELANKTVGIMGVGGIGGSVAKRLSCFDMQIIGYDLFTKEKEYFSRIYSVNQLNEFLPKCDYLILSLPLNDDTKNMIDKSVLDLMKKNVTLINVGRHGLFNQSDFLSVLKKNKEMTAILDMFEIFPNPVTNPFRRLSNVKVLPGVSAISQEINQKRLDLVTENIELVMQDKAPKYQIR